MTITFTTFSPYGDGDRFWQYGSPEPSAGNGQGFYNDGFNGVMEGAGTHIMSEDLRFAYGDGSWEHPRNSGDLVSE